MTEKERNIELAYIQKAKTDKAQFGYLYEKYFEQIFVFIFKKIQEESITADVCSKTFMKAMMHIEKYEDRGFPFSSWLYRIASNEVNQYFRKSNRMIAVQVDEKSLIEITTELEVSSDEENLSRLLSEMDKLPLEKSQLIELRFFEGLSFKEIGSIFNISEASAKMRVYRVVEMIKSTLSTSENRAK